MRFPVTICWTDRVAEADPTAVNEIFPQPIPMDEGYRIYIYTEDHAADYQDSKAKWAVQRARDALREVSKYL